MAVGEADVGIKTARRRWTDDVYASSQFLDEDGHGNRGISRMSMAGPSWRGRASLGSEGPGRAKTGQEIIGERCYCMRREGKAVGSGARPRCGWIEGQIRGGSVSFPFLGNGNGK
jgi:hypothetical protein